MIDAVAENIHRPQGGYPYLQFTNENLQSLAHYHDEMEAVFVEKGEITAWSGAEKIDLSAGDLCFFMPGEIHSFHSASYSNVYVLKMDVSVAARRMDLSARRLVENRVSPASPHYPALIAQIREIYEEATRMEDGYPFAVAAAANRMLAEVCRLLPFCPVNAGRGVMLLDRVNAYLENNYTGRITLDEVADYCHFSKFYFAHRFKELTGEPFTDYLDEYRLQRAQRLLETSGASMTEVALACGFGNARSFHRIFRDRYHTTPLHYRKQHLAEGQKKPEGRERKKK